MISRRGTSGTLLPNDTLRISLCSSSDAVWMVLIMCRKYSRPLVSPEDPDVGSGGRGIGTHVKTGAAFSFFCLGLDGVGGGAYIRLAWFGFSPSSAAIYPLGDDSGGGCRLPIGVGSGGSSDPCISGGSREPSPAKNGGSNEPPVAGGMSTGRSCSEPVSVVLRCKGRGSAIAVDVSVLVISIFPTTEANWYSGFGCLGELIDIGEATPNSMPALFLASCFFSR